MKKVGEELSKPGRENMHPVGLRGGRGPRDINNPGVNIIQKPPDDDRDGKRDYGVSRELSEDGYLKR